MSPNRLLMPKIIISALVGATLASIALVYVFPDVRVKEVNMEIDKTMILINECWNKGGYPSINSVWKRLECNSETVYLLEL